MNNKSIESKTRDVFHNLHLEHLKNEDSSKRFRSLLAPEALKIPDNYFQGKICGDLGCGSGVPGSWKMLKLGAAFVYAMDVDSSFKKSASQVLSNDSDNEGRWQLDVGSLSVLPYKDSFFDFVLCHGVIHHVEEDQLALNEISRVLQKGGKAFITVVGKGGLFNRLTMDIMREEYHNDITFKQLIDDNLSVNWVNEQIGWLENSMDRDKSESCTQAQNLLDTLKVLLDEDFILSLKDILQAPIYHNYTEQVFENMLQEAGFESWYRIGQKPFYNNIRRIVAPLYFDFQSDLSRIFYGDGYLNMVVTK